LSRNNEILLSLSGASNDRLPFRMRPVVENIVSTGTDAEDMDSLEWPTVWNSLPADIRGCTFYGSFIRQLKTFYFNNAF